MFCFGNSRLGAARRLLKALRRRGRVWQGVECKMFQSGLQSRKCPILRQDKTERSNKSKALYPLLFTKSRTIATRFLFCFNSTFQTS